ncbi:MAG: DUF2335 domain-containing protein [Rickettsiales bacterium]
MGVKKYFGDKPQNNPTPFKAEFGVEEESYETDLDGSRPVYYPSPGHLAEYEEIQEGAADRIIALVEAEQTHLHEIQKKTANAQNAHIRMGQFFFFLIAAMIIAGTIFLSIKGYVIPGSALALGGMIMLGLTANRSKAKAKPAVVVHTSHRPNHFEKNKNNFRRRGGNRYRRNNKR